MPPASTSLNLTYPFIIFAIAFTTIYRNKKKQHKNISSSKVISCATICKVINNMYVYGKGLDWMTCSLGLNICRKFCLQMHYTSIHYFQCPVPDLREQCVCAALKIYQWTGLYVKVLQCMFCKSCWPPGWRHRGV